MFVFNPYYYLVLVRDQSKTTILEQPKKPSVDEPGYDEGGG
jgi:hypothetical protein